MLLQQYLFISLKSTPSRSLSFPLLCTSFLLSSNSGFATPYVYGSYGECVARVDALAAGLERGGEKLLDKNDDGMLLVR